MNFHEYQAKDLFAEYGIPVPRGIVAATPLAAQTPTLEPADDQDVPVFGVESAVVLLHIVVRDKKDQSPKLVNVIAKR